MRGQRLVGHRDALHHAGDELVSVEPLGQRLVGQHQPMPQHVADEAGHVLGQRVAATAHEGERARALAVAAREPHPHGQPPQARVGERARALLASALNIGLSYLMVTVMFAMIYKIMPRVRIAWRDVWTGAAITSLLFTAGKYAIGLYIGTSGVSSTFGAAGSLVVILVWVYYSAQIFLLGAEFTWVYAHRYGSRRPS